MAAERILLIEDEPGARQALGSLLADDGYTVCTAEDGRTGLQRLREFHPDTVVCDFYLPDINGLQVLRHARAAAGEITFIFMTGGCGGAEAESALRREADFFFRKPVDLRRFRRALGSATAGRATEDGSGRGFYHQHGATDG